MNHEKEIKTFSDETFRSCRRWSPDCRRGRRPDRFDSEKFPEVECPTRLPSGRRKCSRTSSTGRTNERQMKDKWKTNKRQIRDKWRTNERQMKENEGQWKTNKDKLGTKSIMKDKWRTTEGQWSANERQEKYIDGQMQDNKLQIKGHKRQFKMKGLFAFLQPFLSGTIPFCSLKCLIEMSKLNYNFLDLVLIELEFFWNNNILKRMKMWLWNIILVLLQNTIKFKWLFRFKTNSKCFYHFCHDPSGGRWMVLIENNPSPT